MSSILPSGTVTFLFSDIEGSTRLWEKYPEGMRSVLERHDRYLYQAIQSCQGVVVKTTGDGFHAVFDSAADGVQAAYQAQVALAQDAWVEIAPELLRIRMGLYSGEAAIRAGDYYGTAVNRAARLMSAGHGGQILLSAETVNLIQEQWPEGAELVDLGEHRLKDLVRSEHIFQLNYPIMGDSFPPIHTIDGFPNNLPVQSTTYIGRENEMAEAKQQLSATRLLTLVGPGGTGKTRLSLQLAADELISPGRPFPHGVWLAEFGPISDPDLVVDTVGAIFNLRQQSSSTPVLDMLTSYLREKKLLLLLDNCEHLIGACALLIEHLLRTCPNIKIIASSREVLGVYGENIFNVPSLTMPSPTQDLPEELLQFEAVQLFVERAASIQSKFRLTKQNAWAVSHICRRLDGIPLALELAAARVKLFTAEQVASRLEDRFQLLSGGSRTAIPRQQTLRAMIDWSYDLLSQEEQYLLRNLSVFVSRWSFEAAEFICPDLDLFTLLTNLVNKSLVLVTEGEGEARYSFLETIHEYAAEKLAQAGEEDAVHMRLTEYCLEMTREFEKNIFLTTSVDTAIHWFDQLDFDYENIRAAVEWGLTNRPVEALALAANISFYIASRGSPIEGERWIREALEAVEKLSPLEEPEIDERKKIVARGWIALGRLRTTIGDAHGACTALDKGIPLAHALEDNMLLLGIGSFFHHSAALFMNDIDLAKRSAENLLAVAREKGDPNWEAVGLIISNSVAGKEQDDQKVKEIHHHIRYVPSPLMVTLLYVLVWVARNRGDYPQARIFLEQTLPYIPIYRSTIYEATIRSELGHIYRQMGDFSASSKIYRETIQLWYDLGMRAAIANQLECFAFIARAEGNAQRAVQLLGAAESLREQINSVMTDYERFEYEQELTSLKENIKDQDFGRQWQAGRRLSIDQAVELALIPNSHVSRQASADV
jgi:predicted ATPase/class 3 adenylate cyclase